MLNVRRRSNRLKGNKHVASSFREKGCRMKKIRAAEWIKHCGVVVGTGAKFIASPLSHAGHPRLVETHPVLVERVGVFSPCRQGRHFRENAVCRERESGNEPRRIVKFKLPGF